MFVSCYFCLLSLVFYIYIYKGGARGSPRGGGGSCPHGPPKKPLSLSLILIKNPNLIFYFDRYSVKLWFTTMCFFGFNSVPNLIVILFNLLYPVFIVRFDCKGCVIERECEDSSNWRLKSFREYLATKHLAKWLMWLAHAGMRKVKTRWRQLCLASISRVRPSHETPVRHSVLLDCQF